MIRILVTFIVAINFVGCAYISQDPWYYGVHICKNRNEKVVEVKVRLVVKETKHYILCDLFGKKVWIPKSEIYCGSHVERLGDFGRLIIPRWLAKQKGII